LKLLAEYVRDVILFEQMASILFEQMASILFEQMASRETNLELKEALERQVKAYRKLADERAKELGLPSGTAAVTLSRVDSDALATKFGYARFSRFLRPALKNLRLTRCRSM
jgi:hypothetical protein